MKKIVSFLLLLGMFSSIGVYAGDEYYEKSDAPKEMEDREVIYYDFDLELELENGVVEAEWDEFEGEWFDWYKLVYSTSNSKPVYPYDKTVFVGNENQTESSFKLQRGETYHYVRICAITLNDDYSKDRYCGEVQKLEWDGEYEKEEYKKEYSEKKSYNKTEKKEYVKNKVAQKKAVVKELSSAMKLRVDEMIAMFMERMENADFSDAKIVSTIDTVLVRLKKYERQTKYKALASYMREVLMEYRDEYDNPLDELEWIFEGL